MTPEEAKRISSIMLGADGYCPCCAEELHEGAAEEFPEFPWLDWWAAQYGPEEGTRRSPA